MPWRECSVTEERLRFVARLLEGEGMSEVCREFGISRKTGYKILNRYKDHELDALCDRSRRPVRYANQLPDQVERLIVDLKRGKPQRSRTDGDALWPTPHLLRGVRTCHQKGDSCQRLIKPLIKLDKSRIKLRGGQRWKHSESPIARGSGRKRPW